ncbi:TetR family transcriptional regulator [Janibacter limosus]|uniref:TetR family transcriptional regulator n=1 Tax=Janibacter limosus TaxID=53458 RepID=A0AC61U4I5_9MICO|nr:TetR family transcriptional regulator [Janibacter limosus]UUZ44910.1 TetR family transcriptional regulator [Janibacter limosus]
MSSRATAAGDTRERIRTAALALFAEHGVAATSLREVARSAGVAPGLVGHYFREQGRSAGGRRGLGRRALQRDLGRGPPRGDGDRGGRGT